MYYDTAINQERCIYQYCGKHSNLMHGSQLEVFAKIRLNIFNLAHYTVHAQLFIPPSILRSSKSMKTVACQYMFFDGSRRERRKEVQDDASPLLTNVFLCWILGI